MKMNQSIRTAVSVSAIALGVAFAGPAVGLIVQPTAGGTMLAGVPTDAVGTWGNNAGAVAVAPGWVLTTRHQDSLTNPVDRTVVFDGTSYTADVDNQILFDNGGTTVDARLVPLLDSSGNAASLTNFVEVYDGGISSLGVTVTAITGYGPQAGAAVAASGSDPGGFDWLGNLNNNNPLGVGQNRISSLDTLSQGTFSGMDVFVADFDQPGTGGFNGARDFEATASFGDSGGGWFINDGGTWKIAGLTHAISIDGDDDMNISTTNDNFNAQAFFGQEILATDLRAFASTINNVPEPTSLAFLLSGSLLMASRRRASER